MKLSAIIFSCVLPTGSAFVVPSTTTPPRDELITTQLSAEVSRREALLASSAAIVGAMMNPNAATATSNTFMSEEIVDEPSQQKREDKIDINGAFVVDYKQLPGMYPHAAGMIASHGPYKNVKDIYSIPGLNDSDKAAFKKYEKELTVLPPGRMFKERINQRQST